VAYDLDKGRLWVVCRRCRRWTLAPIEARWEALEEVDRLVSGGSRGLKGVRVLAKTDNVALLRAGPLEIVQIGEAELGEEAWWRYGGQLSGVGRLDRQLPGLLRRLRHGTVAWRGERVCQGCGHVFREIPFYDRKILIVRPQESEVPPTLTRRCPRCRDTEEGGLHLQGLEADLILGRVLAFENFGAASRDLIEAASRMIDDAGSAPALVRILTRHGRPIGDLPPIGTSALEIYAVEARERFRLKLEVDELRACWRREEELAAIMDGELTPSPSLETLKRKAREGG
jgi:hypothetical protein